MTTPYTIRLDETQLEALRVIAKKERRSLTLQFTIALEEWLVAWQKKRAQALAGAGK
jgi:predicted transcriptional regulator